MTAANRSRAADDEREASAVALAEAEALAGLGYQGGVVSRAYYAAHRAARALLYEKGIEPKTHESVRRMVGLHYVMTNLIPPAVGDGLSKLAFMREAADYAPSRAATAGEAAEALTLAREFLQAAGVKPGK